MALPTENGPAVPVEDWHTDLHKDWAHQEQRLPLGKTGSEPCLDLEEWSLSSGMSGRGWMGIKDLGWGPAHFIQDSCLGHWKAESQALPTSGGPTIKPNDVLF